MPTPFDPFVQFFPSTETKDEAQKFIDIIIGDGIIKNLWQLNATPVSTLVDITTITPPSSDPHFAEFYSNFIQIAKDLWTNSQPVDRAKPTPKEALQLSNIWERFYSSFEGKRRDVIRYLAEQYQMNTFEASFEKFQNLASRSFESWLDGNYYHLFSQYYLNRLHNFITSSQHTYEVTGRIVNQADTSLGLGDVRVSIKDENDPNYIRNFGYTTTDRNGYFAFRIALLEEPRGLYDLKIVSENSALGIDESVVHSFNVIEENIIDVIEVTINPVEAESTTVSDVLNNSTIGLSPSTALTDFISSNNILTLRNIREIGGLKNQEEIPDATETSVLVLDSLANLELINPDYEKNYELYSAGITNINQVANMPRSSFVANHRGTLGDYVAAKTHYTAKGVNIAIQTALMGSKDELTGPNGSAAEVTCGCKDCSSAVSPLAYYADLLSFTFNNLKDKDEEDEIINIGFNYLTSHFHMPFGGFLNSCKQLNQTICQNRLATEVLRSYQDDLDAELPTEKLFNYLEHAYRDLLTQLGTSYEELRLARNHEDSEVRQRLASRLGIPLVDPENAPTETLATLFTDLSSGAAALSETWLETIFGLRNSERHPLSFPEESKVSLWKKAYLRELWIKQDYPENPYFTHELPIIDPDIITVDDLRYPFESAETAVFEVWKYRREWLDQFVLIPPAISGLLIPLPEVFELLISGISYPPSSTTINPWSGSIPGPEEVGMDVINALTDFNNEMISGEKNETDLWNKFQLKKTELTRLIEIINSGMAVNYVNDVHDLSNIRIAVIKRYFSPTWHTEENVKNITLGPHLFWHAQNSPKPGEWPISNNIVPFVDPQIISRSDLTEITAQHHLLSTAERELYQNRIEELTDKREAIRALFDGEGATGTTADFENMLTYAFDEAALDWDPEAGPNSYQELLNKTTDPTLLKEAVATIENDLKTTLKDFQFLMAIGKGVEENQPSVAPEPKPLGGFTEADWTRLVDILLRSHKQIVVYTTWTAEEASVDYWKIRKAQLPKWRSSTSQRAQWERALSQHSEAPIIDAAMLRPADLKNYTSGLAYDLLLARHNQMFGPLGSGWKNQMNSEFHLGSTVGNYRDFLNDRLGLPEVSLQTIAEQEEDGVSIAARLEQIGLSPSAFRYLLKIEQTLAANENITEDEKDQVHYIVMNVLKERHAHIYRLEELNVAGEPITHSQDFFTYRETDYSQYPVQEYAPLKPWLASETTKYQWRRKLKSRIDQEQSVIDATEEMAYNTDEKFIHLLRDALIETVGDSERSFYENARILGDRFLIDLENNCCFKTNRIAMAIEVLQQLHWKIRTGDILATYPDIHTLVDDFDVAWQWMGNYNNWRSAMFVFLYPENLMIPALRKKQTPAFKEVINATRNNRRFNPDQACKVARDYQLYLKDINNLSLVCSARAIVTTGKEGCNPYIDKKEDLVFHFAMCESSEKSYYSISSPVTESSQKQLTFWTEIPGIHPDAELKGTHIYINQNHDAHHIYLFYLHKDYPSTFFAVRFDLHDNRWEEEILEFEIEQDDLYCHVELKSNFELNYELDSSLNIPEDYTLTRTTSFPHSIFKDRLKKMYSSQNFRTTIHSFCVLQNTPSWQVPQFAISLYNEHPDINGHMTFHKKLDVIGKKLDEEASWKSYKNFDKISIIVSFEVVPVTRSSSPRPNYGGSFYNYTITRYNVHIDHDAIKNATIKELSNSSLPDLEGKIKFYNKTYTNPWNWKEHKNVLTLEPTSEAEFNKIRILMRENDTEVVKTPNIFLPPFGLIPLEPNVRPIHVFSNPVIPEADGGSNILFIVNDDLSVDAITVSQVGLQFCPIFSLDSSDLPTEALYGNYSVQNTPDEPGSHSQLEQHDTFQLVYQKDKDIIQSYWNINHNYPFQLAIANPFILLNSSFDQLEFITNEHTHESLDILSEANQESYELASSIENPKVMTVTEETTYFVPLQIALQLTQTGHYLEALSWYRTIYDYTKPIGERKIYYGLIAEENVENIFERTQAWFEDPLNPHAVAGMRQHSYTRYTIMCIVQCLLAYADAEFTADTSETVPRARELYEQALALLKLITPEDDCPTDELIASFPEYDIDPIWEESFEKEKSKLTLIKSPADVTQVVADIKNIMQSEDTDADKIAQVSTVIDAAIANQESQNFDDLFAELDEKLSVNTEWATAADGVNAQLEYVGQYGSDQFAETMQKVTGFHETDLQQQTIEWLADSTLPMTEYQGKDTWPMSSSHRKTIDQLAISHPKSAFNLNSPLPEISVSGIAGTFCSVTNPIITALLMHAHVNLFKIRNCMNIAGMVRELSPFSAPTDASSGVPSIGVGGSLSLPINLSVPPSQYRYRVLMERAKQLVSLAQQLENSFLTALEKFDAETYSILRANQDIESSRANIKLQDLKVKESESNVTLAELQKERSELQVSGLQEMIDEGLLDIEMTIIQNINQIMIASTIAQALGAAAQASAAFAAASIPGYTVAGVAGALYIGQSVAQGLAARAQSQMQINQLYASFERRKQEWEFQKTLAQQDVRIGGQQIKIANDRLRITGQEREMAQLQNTHAQASLDFLKNKFTNADLYEFMTRILEDVYEFFLMEATAVAKMAERQLAFERQIELPPFIKSDYWVYEDGSLASGVGESESPDRRGITGSARLLKDLYDLDQHGFMTNTPRLQITKNISLNQLDPVAMQQFRDTGKMTFYTTQEMFDRDYPGHYLRLIKGVSVSVIALTPPVEGIKATLTNSGISSVITGGNIFQKRDIKRQPEQIALSNPAQDKGFLPMQAESEFLHPFEGSGVETLWELRMDKPANPFDFSTIADVIFTIEYEATNSFTYRQTVLNQLNNEPYPGALVLSFKNNLPDQWYELHNPQEGDPDQLSVSFQVGPDDLLVHTQTPEINSVKMFVAGTMPNGDGTDISIGLQTIDEEGELQDVASATRMLSDQINLLDFSTELTGNNVDPKGQWTLTFPNYDEIRNLFQEEKIEDIILVINYNGLPVPYTS